jgi:hypothetical protein
MPTFYFDLRDGEKSKTDKQGETLNGIEDARDAAMLRLSEMAKEVLPGPVRRRLAIEVKSEARETVLVAALMFEAAPPRQSAA